MISTSTKENPRYSFFLVTGILCLAACFYSLLWGRHYVGFLNDDSLLLASSQAILRGSYRMFWMPTHPLITDPFPGFPLFLVPWVRLIAPHWPLAKMIPFSLTLVDGVLLYALARIYLHRGWSLAVMALWLFNPTTVRFSTLVVTEPFFVLLILSSLLLFHELPQKPRLLIPLLVCLGWTVFTRPHGILLAVSMAIGLAFQRKQHPEILPWVPAVILGVPVILLMAWFTFNFLETRITTGYWSLALDSWSRLADSRLLLSRFWETLQGFVYGGVWTLPHPAGLRTSIFLSPLLVIGSLVFIVLGVRSMLRTSDALVAFCAGVFVLLYTLIHILWIALDLRYVLPLLPFLYLFLIIGVQRSYPRGRWQLRLSGILISLLLSLSFTSNVHAVFDFRRGGDPAYYARPRETLMWLSQHANQQTRVLTNKPIFVYLETGFSTTGLGSFQTPEQLARWMHDQGFEWVLLVYHPLINPTAMDHWRMLEHYVTSDPNFKLAYKNPAEATAVFHKHGQRM